MWSAHASPRGREDYEREREKASGHVASYKRGRAGGAGRGGFLGSCADHDRKESQHIGTVMSKVQPPELKKFMDKKLSVTLNANRQVTGVLRGFDQFMNIVLDQTTDDREKTECGMVVIRGASIVLMEALEA